MTNTEKLQKIKYSLMAEKDISNDEAVKHIAKLMQRSPLTVYGWLSTGSGRISSQSLELLTFKVA